MKNAWRGDLFGMCNGVRERILSCSGTRREILRTSLKSAGKVSLLYYSPIIFRITGVTYAYLIIDKNARLRLSCILTRS